MKKTDDQRAWRLFAVFAIAMVVRAAYLLSIRHAPFFEHLVTEPARYDAWARDIVRGVAPVRPPFDEGPAYPYFVALVYAIAGHNVFAVTTLQALMDAGSCVLVAATAERLSGARAAWIAGVVAAFYGPMIYFAGQLEPAAMTVFATSLALFATPTKRASRRDWIVCGATWSLAMFVRSEMILALPLVLVHAWRVEKRAALALVAAPAAALLAMTLAINATSSGHAVLLTTGSGVNFWIGNNEHADGVNPFVSGPMLETTRAIERQTSDAVVADGLFRDRAASFIAHDPARALALFGKKALWLFSDRELPNAMDIERQERSSFLFAIPIFPLRFGMVFPLALAGVVTRRKDMPVHLLAPVAIAFVVAIVFFTCARFRMVMSPALCVFAALALENPRVDLRNKILAAALGALLAFCNVGDVRGYRIKEIDETMQSIYITPRVRRFTVGSWHMHVGLKIGTVGISVASVAALLFACGQAPDKTSSSESAVTTNGALVRMDMASTVGVLLDEIPAGPQREAAAANALAQPASFWEARAKNQVRLMSYRLVFRGQYYSAYWSNGNGTKPKGPLPLPPKQVWNVKASGSPYRTKIDTHDVVVNDYTFQSYIVTDSASPGIVEPALASVGGTWGEPFNLPVDPELLLQRTGYSCMDEDEFPPGSVFEENTWYFYDDACTASDTSTCHVTQKVSGSCNAGLVAGPGHMAATLNFTRVAYDASTASAYRVGTVNSVAVAAGSAADLSVVNAGLVEEHDLAYRFFAPGSCELGEGVIGQLGWRRLLMFSAIVQNDGSGPLEVGSPTDPNNPFVQGNVFEFSQCHGHYHFSHYGTFGYAGLPGSKRAFCLEDTNRYHNDETTALSASHQTCNNQGIERGWGDEYNFGIPGQWVDVTTATTAKGSALTFSSNPDQFLCEGTYALDSQGNYILDATSFINPANGLPESRTRCNFLSNWSAVNFGSTNVAAPNAGSFVTDACNRGQTGPNRDCGFAAQSTLRSCTSGSTVTLSCTAKGSPEVLRVCERSAQLGVGVACTVRDSVANTVVGTTATPVTFACPAIRDAQMVNGVPQTQTGVGGYSLYQATMGTLSSGDNSPGAITCTGF